MIVSPTCLAEAETWALFENIGSAEAKALVVKLGLADECVSWGKPPAFRNSEIWRMAKDQGGTTLADLEAIVREQQGKPPLLYRIYLSCAEGDHSDPLCKRFFEDLSDRLKDRLEDGELRYLDEGNAEDNNLTWSPWSLKAMVESKVLICLYSKSFFNSRYCGRVWSAFVDRWIAYHQMRGLPQPEPAPILPLYWRDPAEYPSIPPLVVRRLEFNHEAFGTEYAKHGLRFVLDRALASRPGYKEAYDDFLIGFTKLLMQSIQNSSLPNALLVPPLAQIPSVFYDVSLEERKRREPIEFANFVFLAARASDIAPLRTPAAYGQEPKHWRPYYPDVPNNIEGLGHEAANRAGLNADSLPLTDELVRKIREADGGRGATIIVVDPWTVKLPGYGRYAQEYDEAALSWSTVIVCWNGSDKDTTSYRSQLADNLRTILPIKFRTRSPEKWRDRIETVSHLKDELIDALVYTRKKILEDAAEPRIAEGSAFIRPELVPQSQPNINTPARAAENEELGLIARPRVEGPTGGART